MRSFYLGTELICCVSPPPLWKLYFWYSHLLVLCPDIIISTEWYSVSCFIYTLRVTVGRRSVFVVCWWTHHRSSPLAWFGTRTTLIWLRMWFTVWELALNWEMWVFCILALLTKAVFSLVVYNSKWRKISSHHLLPFLVSIKRGIEDRTEDLTCLWKP